MAIALITLLVGVPIALLVWDVARTRSAATIITAATPAATTVEEPSVTPTPAAQSRPPRSPNQVSGMSARPRRRQ